MISSGIIFHFFIFSFAFFLVVDVLRRLKDRLTMLLKDLRECVKRSGEVLLKAAKIFIEAVQRHVEGKECWLREGTTFLQWPSCVVNALCMMHTYRIFRDRVTPGWV